MKHFVKRTALILLAALLLLPLAACGQKPAEGGSAGKTYYVDFSAAAGGDGSEAKPFATIPEARDAIRALKTSSGLPDGGVEVILAAGTAHLTETVAFTAEDSGEAGKPIVYRAAEGAEVVLDGGVTLTPEHLTAVPEALRERLGSEGAKAGVVAFDLASAGCYDFTDEDAYSFGSSWTGSYSAELFVDDERQTLARWPNAGEYYTEFRKLDRWVENEYMTYYKVTLPAEKAALWEGVEHMRIFGFPQVDWMSWYGFNVTADPADSSLSFMMSTDNINENRPFYVFNLPEELDVPGEYYYDAAAKLLCYYPAESDLSGRKLRFSQLADDLISLSAAQHLRFEGLTLENGRNSAIATENLKNPYGSAGAECDVGNVTVEDCTVRCFGANGIMLSGTHLTVSGCELFSIGGHGIQVSGGDRKTLTPSQNLVTDNLLHDWAQNYRINNSGIRAEGHGVTVAHNEVFSSPHVGIEVNAGDSLIEYNLIYDVCTETTDSGAIYIKPDGTARGITIRYNLVRDVYNTVPANKQHLDCGPHAIYLDFRSASVTCFGNLISDIEGNGINVGACKNCVFENNVISRVGLRPISVVDGGTGATPNVWYSTDGSNPYWTVLQAVGYTSALWRYSFPQNLLISELGEGYGVENDPDHPGAASLTVRGNVAYLPDGCGANEAIVSQDGVSFVSTTILPHSVITDNLCYADDPGFADEAAGDYSLREDSRVYRDLLHFLPIPAGQIGRRG